MTSPDHPTPSTSDQVQRRRFALALVVFLAWTAGLAFLAFTTAEKPRPVAPSPAPAR